MDGSTERIIKYLQLYDIDINVLFFRVFEYSNQRFISRAWMFEPESSNRPQTASNRSWNGEFYFSFGADKDRIWEDAVKFGFVCAGGGSWYYGTMQMLEINDRIWVNIPHKGYVGVGVVIEKAKKAADAEFNYDGKIVPFYDLPLKGEFHHAAQAGGEEYVVKVKWLKTVTQSAAISEFGFFGNQNTVCRPRSDKWDFTIKRLKELWKIQ
jgi:hypothetical protein